MPNKKDPAATESPLLFVVPDETDQIIAQGPCKVNEDVAEQLRLLSALGFTAVPGKGKTPLAAWGSPNYRFQSPIPLLADKMGIKLGRVLLVDWDGYKDGAASLAEIEELTQGLHKFQEREGGNSIHWFGLLPEDLRIKKDAKDNDYDLLNSWNGTVAAKVDIKCGNQLTWLSPGKTLYPIHVGDLPEVPPALLDKLLAYSAEKRDSAPQPTEKVVKEPAAAKATAYTIGNLDELPREWLSSRKELEARGNPSDLWLGITQDIIKAGYPYEFYVALTGHSAYLREKPLSWLDRTWNRAQAIVEQRKVEAQEITFDLKLPEPAKQLEYVPQYSGRVPIIEGLFTFSSTWMLVAASGTGKTFFTLGTMALASLGQSFGDRCSIPCHNFYFGAEGLSRLPVRIRALEAMYNEGEKIERLHIKNPFNFDLHKPEGWIDLSNWMIEQSKGEPIGIVAFDTLMAVGAAVTPKFDVNNPTSMQLISNRLSTLSNTLGCSAGVIHHPGKSDNKGIDSIGNGNDAIKNGAELFWTLKEVATNGDSKLIAIKQHKDRDGALNNFNFELAPITLDDQRTAQEIEEDKRAQMARGSVKTKTYQSNFVGVKYSSKPVVNPNKTLFLVPEVYEFAEKPGVNLNAGATHNEGGYERNESQPAKLRRFVDEAGADGRTVEEVKEFLESMGVSIKNLSNLTKRAHVVRDGDVYKVDKNLDFN